MADITVSTTIDRTPAEVWDDIKDISTHVTWMADAVAIRFVTEQRSGKGTTFECDTRIGPLRTTDVMHITAWDEGRRMGVRHVGVVKGEGEFTLEPAGSTGTRFQWQEQLTLPWWMGGPVGEVVARPVLTAIWRRNLRRLRDRIEGSDRIE